MLMRLEAEVWSGVGVERLREMNAVIKVGLEKVVTIVGRGVNARQSGL